LVPVAVIVVSIGGYYLFVPSEVELAAERLHAQLVARYKTIQPRAAAGEAAAQFAVAEHLRRGLGIDANPAQAMEWYRKAANQAHIGAQLAIGRMFESGDGVRQDFNKAAEWYQLAANIGNSAPAEFALAELYYHGRGVPNDPSEAIRWYGRAANQGHAGAQFVLGSIHEKGWGVEPDSAEALKWYVLANRKRSQAMSLGKSYDPQKALDELSPRMTRFDMKRGQKMAREWKASTPVRNRLREGTSLVTASRPTEALEPEPEPRQALRILSLEVPLAGEKKENLPINVLLELHDPSLSLAVCGLAPRIRDSILQALWKVPVPTFGGHPDLRRVHDRLLGPVNEGLGQPVVESVYLLPGERPLTANETLRTPFDQVRECHAVAAPASP
jgi:Sel1 repeat-containing protein